MPEQIRRASHLELRPEDPGQMTLVRFMMAYVNTTRAIGTNGVTARLAALLAELRLALARRAVYRQTFSELSALSDRELNDLGLHRSSLRSVALDAAYGG